MIVRLFLRDTIDFVFQVFRICHFYFFITINHLFSVSFIRYDFICKKSFMDYSIKHSCSEKPREVFFILLRGPTWEYSDKLT